MKKAFALILAAVLLCTASCGGGGSAVTDGTTTGQKTELITETTGGGDMTEPVFNPDGGENTLYHIILLGQSLSMGYSATGEVKPCKSERAFMFRQVRTQDLGYCLGISREEYNADPEKYDSMFYAGLKPLAETGGDGNPDTRWEDASWNEYETPASGVVSGLYNAYRRAGYDDIPYRVLVSAPGIGGTPMSDFGAGGKIYRRTEKDIENGKRLAAENGLDYRVLAFIWIQGEAESYLSVPAVDYAKGLVSTRKLYTRLAKKVTGQEETPEFVTYQTATVAVYNPTARQIAPLGQFAAAYDGKNGIALSAPCYQFEPAGGQRSPDRNFVKKSRNTARADTLRKDARSVPHFRAGKGHGLRQEGRDHLPVPGGDRPGCASCLLRFLHSHKAVGLCLPRKGRQSA